MWVVCNELISFAGEAKHVLRLLHEGQENHHLDQKYNQECQQQRLSTDALRNEGKMRASK